MYKKLLAILLAMALVLSSSMVVMASAPAEGGSAEEDAVLAAILEEILAEAGYTPGDEEVAETFEAIFGDVTEDGDFDPENIVSLGRELFVGYGEEGDAKTNVRLSDLNDAIYNHLVEETSEYLEAGDETIISAVIGDLDEHEDGTAHLLAYFIVMNFDADEECPDDLYVKNGAGLTELLTFELNEDGEYEVTDCITAEDGESYFDSVAEMCEHMEIDPDIFYEELAISDLTYVSDLHNFLDAHPEYDHIEYMGELASHEDLDNFVDELFTDYLALYSLAELVEEIDAADAETTEGEDAETADAESADAESTDAESAGESTGTEQVEAREAIDAILTAIVEAVEGVDLEAKEAVIGAEFSEDGTVFSLLEAILTDIVDVRAEAGREEDESVLQAVEGLSSLGEEDEISEEDLEDLLGLMLLGIIAEDEEAEESEGLSDLDLANAIASFVVDTVESNEVIAEAVEATDSSLFELLESCFALHEDNANEDGTMHQIGETEDDLFDEIEEELAKVEEYIDTMEGPKQAALDVLEVLHTVVDEVHDMIHSSAQGESADGESTGESADAESADGESADAESSSEEMTEMLGSMGDFFTFDWAGFYSDLDEKKADGEKITLEESFPWELISDMVSADSEGEEASDAESLLIVDGNDMVMTTTFLRVLDDEEIAELVEQVTESNESDDAEINKLKSFKQMEEGDIDAYDVALTLVFINGDGTVIYEHTDTYEDLLAEYGDVELDEEEADSSSSSSGESTGAEAAEAAESADSSAESADAESADAEPTEGEADAELVDLHELIDLMLNEIVETAINVDLEAKEAVTGDEFSEEGTVFTLLEDVLNEIFSGRSDLGLEDSESLTEGIADLEALGEEDTLSEEELDDLLGLILLSIIAEAEENESEESSNPEDLIKANTFAIFVYETAKANEVIAEAVEATDSSLFEILDNNANELKPYVNEDGTMNVVTDISEESFEAFEEELAKVEEYINGMEGPKQAALDLLDLVHSIQDDIHNTVHGHTHEEVEAAE